MTAYYNDSGKDAADTLRSLEAEGLIAPGHIDDRSIKEVTPDDLKGFTQCHFFAGAGLWSVAARLAGWPDDRQIWTGSCPCQPFSAAGKGLGTNDPRHLWPDFFRLIRAGRPPVIMGEQVAGAPGYGWFDGVKADLASEDFAGRTVDIPACAVDSPQIRQRLYWCAVDYSFGNRPYEPVAPLRSGRQPINDADGYGDLEYGPGVGRREGRPEYEFRSGWAATTSADACDVVDGSSLGRQISPSGRQPAIEGTISSAYPYSNMAGPGRKPWWSRSTDTEDRPFDTNLYGARNGSNWAGSEWIICHDGKARRTEPGLRLLVDGMAGRISAWRLGGNSISPILAAEIIAAFMDCTA